MGSNTKIAIHYYNNALHNLISVYRTCETFIFQYTMNTCVISSMYIINIISVTEQQPVTLTFCLAVKNQFSSLPCKLSENFTLNEIGWHPLPQRTKQPKVRLKHTTFTLEGSEPLLVELSGLPEHTKAWYLFSIQSVLVLICSLP